MTTNKIEIGDFIKGSYKFGCVCGIVTEVHKSIVIIKKCDAYYNEYTITDKMVNVTKSRINQVGLSQGEKIKQSN